MICHVYRRGKIYWGKLQLDHEPRLSRFSLGTTDRRIAQIKLIGISIQREKEHAGLLPPQTTRDAAIRPILDLLRAFLEDLKVMGRAPNTVTKYGKDLGNLFTRAKWRLLSDVTVRSFCEWRAHSGLSGKTLNDLLGSLQSFFAWLVRQRLALENPLVHVQRIDTRATRTQYRRCFTAEELSRLLEVAPPHRRLVYLTAVYTGLRRSEMNGLQWGDVALDSPAPHIRARASTTKNRKEAVLPLHPDLAAELRAIRPPDAAPFSPVLAGMVPKVPTLRRDLSKAGIAYVDGTGRRLDLHSLRVTYGTNLTLSGAFPRVVMELMRHSQISLTMKLYTDAGQLPLTDAVSKLPSFAPKAVCPPVCLPCPKTCPNEGHSGSSVVA